TFARSWSAPSHHAEEVAEADRCNRGPFTGRFFNGREGAAKQAGKGARIFRVRDERTEDLILREAVDANGLRFVDSRPASWRLNRLPGRPSGKAQEHSR